MWKSLIDKLKGRDGRRGYTLTELLAVIAIVAIVSTIAITSIVVITRTLKFKQRNDYAKTVFMAAQANLSEMRSDGTLLKLQVNTNSEAVPQDHCGFPTEDWSHEYVFTSSEFEEPSLGTGNTYDLVLPVNSVEDVLRDRNIIIEYNPLTGNVYSVFYCDDEILSQYRDGSLPRDEERRKDMMLGYYDGSGLSSSKLELESTAAYMAFDNGEEAVLTVKVPLPELYYSNYQEFLEGLVVNLTIRGETSGNSIGPIAVDTDLGRLDLDGQTVVVEHILDSLKDLGSFANLAAKDDPGKHISDYLSEAEFNLLPGENVKITADVQFIGATEVEIDDAILSGVNPMFASMEESAVGDGYILTLANGRNLQNLNAIAPTVADKVEAVVFTDDIYWNETVDYYDNKYGASGTYENNGAENPCRALPYFVPIHNENLFGTAAFVYPGYGDGGLGDIIQDTINTWVGESIFGGSTDKMTPTLTDELDNLSPAEGAPTYAQTHASIQGNGKKIYNLNIDSSKYRIPQKDDSDATNDGKFYATGTTQVVDYKFTGLFGYVNTPVNNLYVVNPVIKGRQFEFESVKVPEYRKILGVLIPTGNYVSADLYTNPATGALIGAAGFNTLVTNCGVYLDTEADTFDRGYLDRAANADYNQSGVQNWYGVSGEGAVGGLIGYAKSHRTTSGELTDDVNHLAFANCFAAVPVTGNMRGTATMKVGGANRTMNYGYSNGVGGFIGNSQLTNFYNCYSSGSVRGNGCFVKQTTLDKLLVPDKIFGIDLELDLLYDARTGQGVGGFVGTSHGTRYSNCFATGDVNAVSGSASAEKNYGAGGFVGLMSIDETFAYGNDTGATNKDIAQRTVFTDCYSVGATRLDGNVSENFSGANARVILELEQSAAYLVGDYYQLYAPYYDLTGDAPDFESFYIFKNSYYLSNYFDSKQENSNSCASAEGYDTFTNLPGNHDDNSSGGWVNRHIQAIKDIVIYELKIFGKVVETWTYDSEYFKEHDELEGYYRTNYNGAFDADEWEAATENTTHSYSLNASGAVYPFSKLAGLDYYGDWPGKPLAAGLAYYEEYEGDDGFGYYFDRDSTSTLTQSNGDVVVKDGYVILSANSGDKVSVKVEGTSSYVELPREMNEAFTPGGAASGTNVYGGVFPLTDAVMEKALKACDGDGENFYVKLDVQITTGGSTKEYVMYFNPCVSLTQVNPAADKTQAKQPDTIPSQLYIRSARQFAALSQNKNLWGDDYNYVQQFDIDASAYDWSDAKDVKIGAIGNADHAFYGTYRGNGGYVEQAAISGFEPTEGFFGLIGRRGEVRNLNIAVEDVNVAKDSAESVGVFARVNRGTIENVDLTVKNVKVTAQNYAGLLVGRNISSEVTSGEGDAATTAYYPAVITGCDVTGENVTVNGVNAGGLAGMAKGQSKQSLADLSDNTVKAKLTSNGTTVGGLVGSSEFTKFQNSSVKTALTAKNAENAGGFAGSISDGTVTTAVVELSDHSTAKGNLAGLAGTAANTSFVAADVELANGKSIAADTAAGAFGVVDQITVKNSAIILPGQIKGTTAAAGYACQVTKGSSLQMANVTLTGGSVSASDGKAAGHTVENAGTISNGKVKLGSDAAISGKTEAVGFAGTVSGSVSSGSVFGKGTIVATEGSAAGFAGTVTGTVSASHVTPATGNENYKGNRNGNLTVSGNPAAGFAQEIGSKATVSGSYTLCQLSENGFGFAGSNAGTISGSTSNVTLTGGASFVGTNSGTVINCYGWYGNGKADNSAPAFTTNSGKVSSAYFANIDDPEGTAALYNSKGQESFVAPSQITLDDLNTASSHVWVLDNTTYDSWPYTKNLRPGYYPYPMLRDHYGDWVREAEFAYGVVYYEKYSDDSWAYHVEDLSDPNETVEKISLTKPADLRGNDVEILETGYALFYNANKCPFDQALLGEALEEGNPIAKALSEQGRTYAVVALNADQPVEEIKTQVKISDNEKTANVVPYFADAINTEVYQVRTPEQLNNVGQMPGAAFSQTHNIVTEKFETIETFSGSYTVVSNAADGNTVVSNTITVDSADKTWMTNVTGTVALGDLTVNGAVSKPIFGTVSKTVTMGAVNTGAVEAVMVNTVAANATVTAAQMKTGSIGKSGGIIGTTSGTVTISGGITTGDVASEAYIIGEVTGGTVQTGNVSSGTMNGGLIDKVSGGNVTTGDITVTALESGLINTIASGATVQGTKISATSSDVDFNLFGTVAGTLKNYTIDVGALSSSAVNTVSGTVNGVTLKASSAVLSQGALVGNLSGSGKVIDCAVSIPTVEVKDVEKFGVITAEVSEKASITNTTVKVDTLTVSDLETVIGGLAGSNAGTISGGKVQGTSGNMTITLGSTSASSDRVLTAGGLVGKNTNEIVGNSSAAVKIVYNQVAVSAAALEDETETVTQATEDETEAVVLDAQETEEETEAADLTSQETEEGIEPLASPYTETVTIGGLVGANSGTINGASATGSITTNASASGKSFIIGGAVGKDNVQDVNTTVEYQNVTANVTVDANLATQNTVSGDCPSGKGSVGMFIGYANSGTFNTCSSTAANDVFQFVGKAKIDNKAFSGEVWATNSAFSALTSYSDYANSDGSYPALDKDNVNLSKATGYDSVRPTFSGCTFKQGSATKTQTVGADEFYYSKGSTPHSQFTVKAPQAASFVSVGDVKFIADGIASGANKSRVETQYYYKISDNTYGRVYWSCKYNVLRATQYFTFTYYTDANGSVKSVPNVKGEYNASKIEYVAEFGPLYTLNVPALSSDKYLAVSGSNAVNASGTAAVSNGQTFLQRENLYNFVNSYASSKLTNAVSGTQYNVPAANNMSANFYGTANPVPTYKVDGLGTIELWALDEVPDRYQLLAFSRINNVDYERQYVTSQ